MRTLKGNRILLVLLCLGLCLVLFPNPNARAETQEPQPPAEASQARRGTKAALNTLSAIMRSMDLVQNQIQGKDKEFQAAETQNEKDRIENQRTELAVRLDVLRKNFEDGFPLLKTRQRPSRN